MADIPPPPSGFTVDATPDEATQIAANRALPTGQRKPLRVDIVGDGVPPPPAGFKLDSDISPQSPNASVTTADSRPTSFWTGAGEGFSKVANNGAAALEGLADKIGIAKPINALGSMLGMAPSEADAEATQKNYFAGLPTQGSTFGHIVGETLPMLAIPGGPIAAGAIGGALTTDDRSLGGVAKSASIGAIAGKAGDLALRGLVQHVGQPIVDKISSALGQEVPSALSKTDANVLKQAANPDQIVADLREAQQLGIPATLADVSPQARSLAGAAVRRSPVAAGGAEAALIPRARGQVDRFMGAVQRDLGDITNIPEASEKLMQTAKDNAGPLYEKAYAAPAVASPKIDKLLQTPFGREALGRAQTIAANEGRNPSELGFALGNDGSVVLNPARMDLHSDLAHAQSAYDDAAASATNIQTQAQRGHGSTLLPQAQAAVEAASQKLQYAKDALAASPTAGVAATSPVYSPQTLDYVKRGMDDVLEKYRNPVTGKLVLDEGGRAQNNVKNSLLQEVDRLNPDYKAARAVYAGPASEKAALLKGQTALDKTPDVLASMTKNLSDTQLEQFRLGYVGALTDRANKMRYTSNPFQSLLDNPAMAEKLQMLFPQGNVSRLLRQRDLERGLAATNNKILGNSETAARQIADADFSSGIGPEVANIGLNAAMGHPVGALQSAGRAGANAFASSRFGAAARARAEAIAPKLLNTDPGATADAILAAIEKRQNYRGHVETAKKVSNFFAPMASAVAVSAAGNRK